MRQPSEPRLGRLLLPVFGLLVMTFVSLVFIRRDGVGSATSVACSIGWLMSLYALAAGLRDHRR